MPILISTVSDDYETRLARALGGIEKIAVLQQLDSLDSEQTESHPPAEPINQIDNSVPKHIFEHPDAHPIILDLLLLKKFGPEWLLWEAETTQLHVHQVFGGTISTLNVGKIHAIRTLHNTDAYWEKWEVFNWCTAAFTNFFADFDNIQIPSVGQVAVSVDIANRVRNDIKLSEQVKTFISVVCKFEETFIPPAPLDDIEIIPDNDLLDMPKLKKDWEQVMATKKVPTEDTIESEQIRRTLAAYNYLDESRKRFDQQLKVVQHA